MADCKTLPCCEPGSYYIYSLSNGLYGNPLVPIPGGSVTVYPPPTGGPGLMMDVVSSCCDGSGLTSTIFIPKSTANFPISIQCCNGTTAGGLVTPGMTADQIQALGLTMAIACTNSNNCPPGTDGPGGPFLVKLTCCDGSVEVGTITPGMDVVAISLVANALVAACDAKKVNCGNPPEDPPIPPVNPENPDIYYPNYKVGNAPQTITLCTDGETLTAPDGLPSWASISGNNLTIAANQFFVVPESLLPSHIAAALAIANNQAVVFLAEFAFSALASSFLVCDSGLTLQVIYLPDDEVPPSAATPSGMVAVGGLLYTVEGARITTSPDALTYTEISTGDDSRSQSITYGQGAFSAPPEEVFVTIGADGAVFPPILGAINTSPDGIIWTNQTFSTAQFYRGIAFNPADGIFVAIGSAGTAAWSDDNVTWQEVATGFGSDWRGIAYGSNVNLFVAVGFGGGIYTTPDGITWTNRISGTMEDLEGVAYHNGLFVAVGDAGTIVTSPDGVTWTQRIGDPEDLFAVAAGGGYYVTLGFTDEAWMSTDGINWSVFRPQTIYTIAEANGFFFKDATFVFRRSTIT